MGVTRRKMFGVAMLLALGLLPSVGRAQEWDRQGLAAQITSGDPASFAQAMATVKDLWAIDPWGVLGQIRDHWVPALHAAKRYDDAAELAQRAILSYPMDVASVESLQRQRVQALLASGRNAEALANAKGLLNVCRMESTEASLLLLASCLNAARPEERGLVDRLREEQMRGAQEPAVPAPQTVLASIRVDTPPYLQALEKIDEKYRGLPSDDEFRDLNWRANLLLLADRPTEALKHLRRAQRVALDYGQALIATQNLARAMRAEDGCIAGANMWLKQQMQRK